MTTNQMRWYLREWQSAWKAHWAGIQNKEAMARPDRPEHHPLRDQVLDVARRLAATRQGPLDADCIRHACHVVALGRDIRAMTMTNKQCDLVVAVFRQLAGVNLSAMMTIEQKGVEQERGRLIHAIAAMELPPGYIERIASDQFGTSAWRSLPTATLKKLRLTASARAASRNVGNLKRVATTTAL